MWARACTREKTASRVRLRDWGSGKGRRKGRVKRMDRIRKAGAGAGALNMLGNMCWSRVRGLVQELEQK